MKLSIILKFLCISLISSFQSCGQNTTAKMETYDLYRNQKLETRDSLFVLHTVKEWGRLNWWTWGVREDMYHITQDEIEYIFGGAFYSPDKTKILVWVGTKEPNAKTFHTNNENPEVNKICPNGADTIYSLTAVIGFRDDYSQTWQLYPFNQQQATCFDSKEKVINVLGQYYFEKMAEHEMYRMQQNGKEKGYRKLEAYEYNLQDKDFWEKSWLWQKDNVGSIGLYPFQIKNYRCDIEDYNRMVETYPDRKPNETNGEYLARNGRIVKKPIRNNLKECAEPFELPEIKYPEEILEQFKEE